MKLGAPIGPVVSPKWLDTVTRSMMFTTPSPFASAASPAPTVCPKRRATVTRSMMLTVLSPFTSQGAAADASPNWNTPELVMSAVTVLSCALVVPTRASQSCALSW